MNNGRRSEAAPPLRKRWHGPSILTTQKAQNRVNGNSLGRARGRAGPLHNPCIIDVLDLLLGDAKFGAPEFVNGRGVNELLIIV